MRIQISDYPSKDFPKQIKWKIGSVEYSNVFPNEEAAISYITGRYGINAAALSIRYVR